MEELIFVTHNKGKIASAQKWSDLWYIFIPYGYDKTLAQMTKEERDNRKREKSINSFKVFADWYEKKQ